LRRGPGASDVIWPNAAAKVAVNDFQPLLGLAESFSYFKVCSVGTVNCRTHLQEQSAQFANLRL
jgi:hypothetical protein